MEVYVIIGSDPDYEEWNVLGVTLTELDAQRFKVFYEMGITAAGFDYFPCIDIEKHSVTVFHEKVTDYTRKDEDR